MPDMKTSAISVTLAVLALSAATVASQAPPAQGRGSQPQPILPVAVSMLVAAREKYLGGSVSLTASVDQRFGETAFSIDQDPAKSAPGSLDILVLAPVLTAPV